jgi:hypothetical protein
MRASAESPAVSKEDVERYGMRLAIVRLLVGFFRALQTGWHSLEGCWTNPWLAFVLSLANVLLPTGDRFSLDAMLKHRRGGIPAESVLY